MPANTNMRVSTPSAASGLVHYGVKLLARKDGQHEVRQLQGREYIVIPSIILSEGVMRPSNTNTAALALAEEFGIFPQSWNGRPIVYGHPRTNGEAVSANSPDFWERGVIGYLFDSSLKDNSKLKTFLWIDKGKAPSEVLEGLENNAVFEVSTGIYTLEEETSGEHQGEKYDVIWRNIVPDHLAILPPGSVGACSVEDGCGAPRANQGRNRDMPTTCQQQQRRGSAVANCGSDTSVRANGIKITTNFKKAFDSFLKALGMKANELSDVDRRAALDSALQEALEGTPCYVVAVFSDKVVYMTMSMENYTWGLFQRSYSAAEGGAITLSADVTEVRPETRYVPLVVTVDSPTTNVKGSNMNQDSNAASGSAPASGASHVQSASASAASPAAATPTIPTVMAAAAAQGTTATAPVSAATPAKVKTLDELLALAEGPVQEGLKAIIKANKERMDHLVKTLAGKVGLSEEELRALSSESLEKMASKLAPQEVVNYAGAAGSPVQANATAAVQGANQIDFTPAPRVFELLQPGGGEKKAA